MLLVWGVWFKEAGDVYRVSKNKDIPQVSLAATSSKNLALTTFSCAGRLGVSRSESPHLRTRIPHINPVPGHPPPPEESCRLYRLSWN